MKILCIGNSFSQDATKYLHQISDGEIFVRNLYIGGCSLETHWNNIVGANRLYGRQDNGSDSECDTSINEALLEMDWDFITVQQVSHFSGMPETYEPFLTNILSFIKEKCPNTKIAFHRTWAYDDKSDHFGFAYYERSRQKMNEAIIRTSGHFASVHNLPIIPNCEAIESARALTEFQGELNMNRDGFHLSLDYGRYLAGLTMYGFFTGKDATAVGYEPEETDPQINKKLKEIAKSLTFSK